jgi:Curlin associated repeat
MKTKLAKITMAMLGVAMSLGVMAADNSIYIDQTGNNSTIAITQDGYGNVVKGIAAGSTTPALINGINNSVTVNQVGISNTLSLGIQTTTNGSTTLPDGSTVSVPTINYSVTGNNATAVINSNNSGSGTSASNYIDVEQTGNYANANINMLGANNAIKAVTDGGDNNSVVATVKGNNNIDNVRVTGDSNSVTISQGTALLGSNSNTIGIKVNGASNTFGITQTGGTSGSSVSIGGYATDTSYGSSNSVTVSQSGANDNSLTLGLTGSNNTIGVTQTATAGNNNANLKVNSSSSNISITQTNRQ